MSTTGKYFNAASLGFSYYCSVLSGRSLVWGMPFATGIELTNHCNLNCPHCASGSGLMKRARGYMEGDLFERIREELSGYLLTTLFYFQGESMLHPMFFEFIEKMEGMGTIISTNGHYLSPENSKRLASSPVNKIIVSLDGITSEVYTRYRTGGDLDKVKSGIESLSAELRRKNRLSRLEIQILVNRYNEKQLDDIQSYIRGLGAKVRLKSMQLIDGNDSGLFLPGDDKYRRYKNEGERVVIRSDKPDRCFRLWTNPVITWDGKVLPCCFDKDGKYVMGNIGQTSFREIWFGEKYISFRKTVLSNRSSIDICNNCTEGLKRKIVR